MVTLKSKTPCLSEDTEGINEISVKLPSQFTITKITTSFDNIFDQLSMSNSFEAAKFELDTKFEKTINETKDNNLKCIASAATNTSAITSFEYKFDPICINNIFKAEKFEPEPTFENTINEIKFNHLKGITFIDMNVPATTPKTLFFS